MLKISIFQVDVRNLIIDLDADIKADTMMANREKTEPGPTVQPSSRPHLPVGGAPSRPALGSETTPEISTLPKKKLKPNKNADGSRVLNRC